MHSFEGKSVYQFRSVERSEGEDYEAEDSGDETVDQDDFNAQFSAGYGPSADYELASVPEDASSHPVQSDEVAYPASRNLNQPRSGYHVASAGDIFEDINKLRLTSSNDYEAGDLDRRGQTMMGDDYVVDDRGHPMPRRFESEPNSQQQIYDGESHVNFQGYEDNENDDQEEEEDEEEDDDYEQEGSYTRNSDQGMVDYRDPNPPITFSRSHIQSGMQLPYSSGGWPYSSDFSLNNQSIQF
jgi:hypothetical protein